MNKAMKAGRSDNSFRVSDRAGLLTLSYIKREPGEPSWY